MSGGFFLNGGQPGLSGPSLISLKKSNKYVGYQLLLRPFGLGQSSEATPEEQVVDISFQVVG